MKPAKPHNRSWWISKKHVAYCYASTSGDCHVTSLWESFDETAASFYDADLARATREINDILTAIRERNSGGKELSFIVAMNRPFLAWTTPSSTGPDEPGTIGPNDDFDAIKAALGLTAELPAKPHKRSWIMGGNHIIYCFASPKGDCVVTSLWEASDEAAMSFHDADLARATKEINAILAGIKEKKDPGRNLSFIVVENRLFLVWTDQGAVGPDDDPDTIEEELGLRT